MCLTRAGLANAATPQGTDRSSALTGATTAAAASVAQSATPRRRRASSPGGRTPPCVWLVDVA
jgi:hypothetical protein